MGTNADECDEIVATLKSVTRSKFEPGRKQRNLKRRWETCQEVVGRDWAGLRSARISRNHHENSH